MRIYLFCYSNIFTSFRMNEFNSIIQTYNLDIHLEESEDFDVINRPYLLVSSGNPDDIVTFASRSVLLKRVLIDVVTSTSFKKILPLIMSVYSNIDPIKTIRIDVSTFLKSISQEEKMEYINEIIKCTFETNKIELKNYDLSYWLMFDYSPFSEKKIFDCLVYFGQFFTKGSTFLSTDFCIKNRPFIGNTTLDPTLSFLMVNQAQIKPNDVVCDPFCGTGGILVAAARVGAYVFGLDVKYTLLHGLGKSSRKVNQKREKDENIFMNFFHYELQNKCLGFVVGDCGNIKLNPSFKFDAIITDPPYGIREKSLSTSDINKNSSEDLDYAISILFNFATNYLKEGGFLVYWQPVIIDKDLPYTNKTMEHSQFALVSTSLQYLHSNVGRLLVTMKKIQPSPMTMLMSSATNLYVKQLNQSFRNVYFDSNLKKTYK